MPSTQTLERFIARVEENAHAEAIDEFYAEHATMQENQSPPRGGGRARLVDNEKRMLARANKVESTCLRPVFVNGDHVAIRWVFRFEWLDGSVTRMEEMAWQRWEDERIVEETFFYDPAQMVPKRDDQ